MVLLRQLLGDVLRRLRIRQGRTLREVSASARVSLGYLSEVERGRKEASSELLAAICAALDTPLSQVFREVSDNFSLAELQNEPVLSGALREVSASARVSLGYLSEVERGRKEASSELLAAICAALDTPLSQVFREVSDNFSLAELQNEPVLSGALREPGLRIPSDRIPVKRVAVDVPEAAESLDDDLGHLDDGLDHLPSVVGV